MIEHFLIQASEIAKKAFDKIPDFSNQLEKGTIEKGYKNVPDFHPSSSGSLNSVERRFFEKDKILSGAEKLDLQKETGWSDKIMDAINTREQFDIYRNADLIEKEIDGKQCLIKRNINLDSADSKTGLTNAELMEKGRSPVISNSKIELHHMNQKYDGPLAELTDIEHGGANHSVLHSSGVESWRNDPDLNNAYNNVVRPGHWKARVSNL